MLKLVARISKFFGALLIIFKVTTKLFWWSNKIIFRFVFSKILAKSFFLCTIIATCRSRLRWILNVSIWETEFREISFHIWEHQRILCNYPERYSIKTLSFSLLSYHEHSHVIVSKGSESYSIHREQAESRFWSGRGCGESLHFVIEENRLFLRVMVVSRSRKISVIAQKYTRYCYPKLFYDRFLILLTIWTIKMKKIFYQAAIYAETIRHLDNRN